MNCQMHCRYYTERVLAWSLNNKMIVFLGLLSFCLFVSTLAMAGQRNRLQNELDDYKAVAATSTTVQPPGDNSGDNNTGGSNENTEAENGTTENETTETATTENEATETATTENSTTEETTTENETTESTSASPSAEEEDENGNGDDGEGDSNVPDGKSPPKTQSILSSRLLQLMGYASQ